MLAYNVPQPLRAAEIDLRLGEHCSFGGGGLHSCGLDVQRFGNLGKIPLD